MRKEYRDALLILTAATTLVGCAAPVAPKRVVETPQVPVPGLRISIPDESETRTPTPTQPETQTPTPTVRATETDDLTQDKDTETRKVLSQASVGDLVELSEPNIGYIVRTPWIGKPGHLFGEAVIVTYDTDRGPKHERLAVSTQGDCVLEALRANNELGKTVFPGTWNPNKPLDTVRLEIVGSTNAAGLSIPIVETETVQKNGVTYNCDQISGAGRLKQLISSVDWGQKAEDIGRIIASKVYRFILGIQDGIATPTAAP